MDGKSRLEGTARPRAVSRRSAVALAPPQRIQLAARLPGVNSTGERQEDPGSRTRYVPPALWILRSISHCARGSGIPGTCQPAAFLAHRPNHSRPESLIKRSLVRALQQTSAGAGDHDRDTARMGVPSVFTNPESLTTLSDAVNQTVRIRFVARDPGRNCMLTASSLLTQDASSSRQAHSSPGCNYGSRSQTRMSGFSLPWTSCPNR